MSGEKNDDPRLTTKITPEKRRLRKQGVATIRPENYVEAVVGTVKFGLIVALIACVSFAIMGVVLVYVSGNDAADSVIRIFGQEITTGSIGLAIIVSAAICFVVCLRKMFSVLDKL